MKKLLHLFGILFFSFTLQSQVCEYLGPDQILPCGQTSTTITADFSQCVGGFVPPKLTNTYLVQNIPFAPSPNTGTQVFLGDDASTGALPIGFSFCFLETLIPIFTLDPMVGFHFLPVNQILLQQRLYRQQRLMCPKIAS
jgi:hypothetical protein